MGLKIDSFGVVPRCLLVPRVRGGKGRDQSRAVEVQSGGYLQRGAHVVESARALVVGEEYDNELPTAESLYIPRRCQGGIEGHSSRTTATATQCKAVNFYYLPVINNNYVHRYCLILRRFGRDRWSAGFRTCVSFSRAVRVHHHVCS